MTNAEKLILKDEKAKKAVTDVLKIFDVKVINLRQIA